MSVTVICRLKKNWNYYSKCFYLNKFYTKYTFSSHTNFHLRFHHFPKKFDFHITTNDFVLAIKICDKGVPIVNWKYLPPSNKVCHKFYKIKFGFFLPCKCDNVHSFLILYAYNVLLPARYYSFIIKEIILWWQKLSHI